MKLIWLILLLLPFQAIADDFSEWHIIEMDKAYVDYMHFTYAEEPFLQPYYSPTNRLDLHVNLKLFDDVMFLDNMVHSETDQYQFRVVGLNYRLGIHLGDSVDLYYEHYSQHMLDAVPQYGNKYDAVGIRVYLYKEK